MFIILANWGSYKIGTKKLFWENPYQKECTARVVDINHDKIVLDQSVFYAESGGQESDSGTIGDYEVIKAEKQEDIIIYTLNRPYAGNVGDEVKVKIDWEKRYNIMKLHSVQHIVAEYVMQKYENVKDCGSAVSSSKARIDFAGIKFAEILQDIENNVHVFLQTNKLIETYFDPNDAKMRLWRMADFATMNCAGTHVKNTSEIGKIKLKRKSGGANRDRIEIYLAE